MISNHWGKTRKKKSKMGGRTARGAKRAVNSVQKGGKGCTKESGHVFIQRVVRVNEKGAKKLLELRSI